MALHNSIFLRSLLNQRYGHLYLSLQAVLTLTFGQKLPDGSSRFLSTTYLRSNIHPPSNSFPQIYANWLSLLFNLLLPVVVMVSLNVCVYRVMQRFRRAGGTVSSSEANAGGGGSKPKRFFVTSSRFRSQQQQSTSEKDRQNSVEMGTVRRICL